MNAMLERGVRMAARGVAGLCGPVAAMRLGRACAGRLPVGKAIKAASICLEEIPLTPEVREEISRVRFRWGGAISARIEPRCMLSRLCALTGFHEPALTEELLKPAHSGVMVDIGANFGYFPLLWLSKPGTRVLAVEPVPQTFAILEENLSPFAGRAVAVRNCIGEERKTVSFSYDPDWPMLARVGDGPAAGMPGVEMVPLRELLSEHGIDAIDVLKIDTEGYDITILQSVAEMFTARRIKSVFWESLLHGGVEDTGQPAFIRLLLEAGYRRIGSLEDPAYTCAGAAD